MNDAVRARPRGGKRTRAALLLAAVTGALLLSVAHASAQEAPPPCGGMMTGVGDPCGDATGAGADVLGTTPAEADDATVSTLADQVGKQKISLNFAWTLMAGFLVMFMQAGFALVETGFCRKKNAAHVMMTNFVIYPIGILGFFIAGYALMFGGVGAITNLGGTPPLTGVFDVGGWNLFGTKGFAFNGIYDVGVMTHFLFNLVFMDTAATIVTGAMAERWKFSAFVVFGFFMAMVIYPLFGMWAWGGGWLAQLGAKAGFGHGYVDFAGSGVVHAVGGFTALAGAVVIGPRIGKYVKGKPVAMPGHHIPMALLGTFILAFGWFGFNAGSTLASTDLRISVVAVNTMLASASGAFAAMLWVWRRFGKPDPSMTANGMLAGLVAITAPSGFVAPWAALLIGAIGGALVVESVLFIDRVLKVDDPVGAISVHGVNGLWGLIALGLFADGTYGPGWNLVDGTVKGLFYGDAGQLVAQLIGCATVVIWAGGLGFIFFRIQDAIQGIRSAPEAEEEGLDVPEMGVSAYVDELVTVAGGSAHAAPAGGRRGRAPTGASGSRRS